MSDEQQQHPGAPHETLAPAEYPGALLRAAREEAKLSEDDVARELRLTVNKVRALEADDYDRLHSDTFIRGYLRTYAKLLGKDPDEILEAYRLARRAAGLGDAAEESPLQINIPEQTRPLWKFAIWILVLLVGIWALSVWFLGNRQDSALEADLVDPLAEMTAQVAAASSGAENRADTGSERAEDEGTGDAASADQSGDTEGEPTTVDSSSAVEPLATTEVVNQESFVNDPEVLDQLRITLTDECWVEVTDSRGDVLETDLVRAGRELSLSGEAPFTVKLGNSASASVEINGEPFEFVPPPSGRLVTLTVR